MSMVCKYSARFLVIVAVIALVQTALVPSAPAHNPYVSALSSVSVGSTYAIPINCPNNSCGGKKGCRADHGFYCDTSSGTCQTSKCL
jgi:hypothetical protein